MTKDLNYSHFTQKSRADKAINTLKGLVQGIIADGVVTEGELEELRLWADKHAVITQKKPYNEFMHAIADLEMEGPEDLLETVEDIFWLCQKVEQGGEYYDALTVEFQTLLGFFHGLLADGELTDDEVWSLNNWLETHAHLEGNCVYDSIFKQVQTVLEDDVITEEERVGLVMSLNEQVEILRSDSKSKIAKVLNVEAPNSSNLFNHLPIVFDSMIFVLTGEFETGKKGDISSRVMELGGVVKTSPSKNTHFVVIGGMGNSSWAFTRYGRKVEKALQLRSKGGGVSITSETKLLEALG
jgi:hypothetical protein